MNCEEEVWSCCRSSPAPAAASPAPSSCTASATPSTKQCSSCPSRLTVRLSSVALSKKSRDIFFKLFDKHFSVPLRALKQPPCLRKESDRHSLHGLYSDVYDLSQKYHCFYSSCPSVFLPSYSPPSPPPPPPRRAESFLCVSQHLRARASYARCSYERLLQRVLQARKGEDSMTEHDTIAEHAPMAEHTFVAEHARMAPDAELDNNNYTSGRLLDQDSILQQQEVDSHQHINGKTVPQPELPTPSFTPPPPIAQTADVSLPEPDVFQNCRNKGSDSRKAPMFIYSYDPPTPERCSVYDPPLPALLSPRNVNNNEIPADVQHENTNNKYLNSNTNENTVPEILAVASPDSNFSSSTLSATLLLTQDSDVSPLPPHAVRVSPMDSDTMTTSSPTRHASATTDPSATYTCTSPAYSNYSGVHPPPTDLSAIATKDFSDVRNANTHLLREQSPETSEPLEGNTPDTVCVSPLQSERCTQSNSKTSEDRSLHTQSISDTQRKSNEAVSDPTNPSSDRARRSSPSSPDVSLSSLPSDTITINAGIESIGTDSDPNESSAWSTGNVNREVTSYPSYDDMDPANDSAFASPSTSPTFSKSCTITPILMEQQDSCLPTSSATQSSSTSQGELSTTVVSEVASTSTTCTETESQENRSEEHFHLEFVDETTESESIYPESECDIRLTSRADTESVQRDSSPERQTPIIAEICCMESDSNESSKGTPSFLRPHDVSCRTLNEISSSGNSSMSNSPALSFEIGAQVTKKSTPEEQYQKASTCRLSNWLTDNNRNFNSTSDYILSLPDNDLPDRSDLNEQTEDCRGAEDRVIIEEMHSQPISSGFDCIRSFPYFGPLPTIPEVDSSLDDCGPSSLFPVFSSNAGVDNQISSSIMSSHVHSGSPRDVTSTESPSRSMDTAGPVPPLPPPRSKHPPLKTPPIPPPPLDENFVNLYPLPPPPSEEACIPPVPPPPIALLLPDTAPPVPPHGPTPPQRMYLLIPLAPGLRSPRRMASPPPAPLRSTSLRRSPPPPPPRSAIQTPSCEARALMDINGYFYNNNQDDADDDDNRTVSSSSDVGSVICVSKLTPVPEDKPKNSSVSLAPALMIASPESNSPTNSLSQCNYRKASPSRSTDNRTKAIVCAQLESKDVRSSPLYQSLAPPHSLTSGVSPPPPTPPRGRISITPPRPPTPSSKITFSDGISFSDDKNSQTGTIPKTGKMSNVSRSPPHHHMQSPPPPPHPPRHRIASLTASGHDSSPTSITKQEQKQQKEQESGISSCVSPLLSVSSYGKLVVDRSDLALPTPEEEVGRVFSSGLRWGWLEEGVDTIAMYTQLRPIIQRGPQCGLVALSMASQHLCGGGSGASTRRPSLTTPTDPSTSGGSPVSAAALLEAAQSAGYSTHGEMFSARSLAALAELKLGGVVEAAVTRDVLRDKHRFLELMLTGALLLVPYDAQNNHQPGLYSGHKAHWGVVSGALVQSKSFATGAATPAAFARPDARIDHLWHVRRGYHRGGGSCSSSRPSSRATSRTGEEVPRGEDAARDRERSTSPCAAGTGSGERGRRAVTPSRGGALSASHAALTAFGKIASDDLKVLVLWRQGKSRLLVSAPLEELCASNAQLLEYPCGVTDAGGYEKEFVIGNVEEGLAGQVVVLSRTTRPLTALAELLDRLQT